MSKDKGGEKREKKESLRNTTPEGKTLDTWLYYSGKVEDGFYILFV